MICREAKKRLEKIRKNDIKDRYNISDKCRKILKNQEYVENGICPKCGEDIKGVWYNIFLYCLSLGFYDYLYKCDNCGKRIRRLLEIQYIHILGLSLY